MKTIWLRLKAETPNFWKKVRTSALSIGGSAVAVIMINKTMELNLLPILITICNYVIAASAAIAGTASLTKKD
jgi:hypothetical protein